MVVVATPELAVAMWVNGETRVAVHTVQVV